MKDFAGKVAVVTGAASGIGRAMALDLARRGVRLVLADIEPAPLEAVRGEVKALGVDALTQVTDVSRLDAVTALADAAYGRFGAVHVLCNNAGVAVGGGLEKARHEDWQWVLGVNLWGVIHGVEAFVPRMIAGLRADREHPQGHVVNTASMAGLIASKGLGIYNTAKSAVVGLSETLAKDLRDYGIGVSVLCPMGVQTRINESERTRPDWARTAEPAEKAPPLLGRWIPPETVSAQVMEAIAENRLYVLTHYEGREHWERRAERIRRAFPPPP
jgi:NAD(P)-dependent dehydrogenase (short-subunit alcohol dehydrogenase family)